MPEPKYKVTPHIDWLALQGIKVRVEVSPNYVILVKPDGSFITILQAVKPRKAPAKPEESPSDDELRRLMQEARDAVDMPPFAE